MTQHTAPEAAPAPGPTAALPLDVELLEPLLRQFVELIGLGPTMALVDAHGGTRLCIAEAADENAALVALIGADKAAILGRHFGRERPVIPKGEAALRALRDRRIGADLEHMSVRRVALKYGLTERRIWQIQAELGSPETATTAGLFD